jgi:hypothetical protein
MAKLTLDITFRADEEGRVWVDLSGKDQMIAACYLKDEPSPAMAEGIVTVLNACAAGSVALEEREHQPAEVALRTVFRRRVLLHPRTWRGTVP